MSSFDVSSSGLSAQRRRIEIIAENLANAETTRTSRGGPYRRRMVVFSEHLDRAGGSEVQVSDVVTDPRPGKKLHQPGHPDADEQGFVTYPNVNPIEEMVDMIGATRAYEANVTALNATKAMVRAALDLGSK